VGLVATLFLRLPLEAGYLIPAVPFVRLLLGSCSSRDSFRLACLGLIASPFFLAIVALPERDPRGIALLAHRRLADHEVALTLAGSLPVDQWRRRWDVVHAGAILAAADMVREPSLLAVGFGMPIVQLLNAGDTHRGLVEFVPFLTGEDLQGNRCAGRRLLYVPGVEDFNLMTEEIDLPALGGQRLAI
jgi:hypothetical protein